MSSTNQNPETLQAAQFRPRLGSDLVVVYDRIREELGEAALMNWIIALPKEEWQALMEAKRTGMKA